MSRHHSAVIVVLVIIKPVPRPLAMRPNPGAVDARMVHEKAPDEAVMIAEAVRPPLARAYQHQAGVLDSACREYEYLGRHARAPSRQRRDPDGAHLAPTIVRVDVDGIGVEVNRDVGGPLQLIEVVAAEPDGRTELRDPVNDPPARQRQPFDVA